ncbi:DMT family transporter [Rhodospirillaceae bacterium]|nr:DMT family transporter [Rhodospirillaceae bacterium]|tara:strand:+ start:1046 stop:1909 length:864 start_codon:yes stop_codon:yes gene_type:complete
MAISLMAVAAILFVAMHTVVRSMSGQLHPFEIAFFRAFLGLFVLLPFVFKDNFSILKTKNIKLHSLRGILNAGAMLCFFYGLSITPLAQVTALGFSAPLFATVLAVIFLGEVVRVRRWTAIIIGFLGTMIILRPGMVDLGIGPLLIVISAAIWSVALMVIKVMTRTDSSVTISFYASVFLSPLVFFAAFPFWELPSWEQLGWMFLLAALGTFAQTLMNQSLKLADTSVVMPVDFSKMIWATLLGFVFFDEVPDFYTWVGAILIFGSTTYIAIRESRLKQVSGIKTRV